MKLIELTGKPGKKGGIQKAVDQINKLLPFGKTSEHAEDAIVARLARGMDNRFVLVRNLPVEGREESFPPILIGPVGIILLNICPIQGYFRAKEESWWEMSKTTHRYNPGRPNLLKQSQEYAQELASQLDKRQKSHPEVIPILLFANPGVQVEMSNPPIRIVLMDGVENLIGTLLNSEAVLTSTEIDFLADALEIMGNPEKAIPMGEGEDFFGRDLLEPEKKASFSLPKVKLPTKTNLTSVEEKLNFSPKQWLIIEILMILLILVLIVGVVYILLAY
ncbi:MAG TPA: nuclease-related domain-containing protein [Anaerolineales bacterium]|nr:nuclease-related domain-containing protein [Anaerolineales bacterium]